jgi:hypothetical protein
MESFTILSLGGVLSTVGDGVLGQANFEFDFGVDIAAVWT